MKIDKKKRAKNKTAIPFVKNINTYSKKSLRCIYIYILLNILIYVKKIGEDKLYFT